MRQANSTIKGYLYQFNKSLDVILGSNDDVPIVLEGVIEDIDVHMPSAIATIQCKYHEDKKFQLSSVAAPILEMLCHYCESIYLGKRVSYYLFAYYSENVDEVDRNAFLNFLNTTKDKEILSKYFHRIYIIPDSTILKIAIKEGRTKQEKEQLLEYYKTNRTALQLRIDINDFWNVFTYVKAEQFEVLKGRVIQKIEDLSDHETAISLYYPNAFSHIAFLSAKETETERTITRSQLMNFLFAQKSVLLNKWTLEATDKAKLLKAKKQYLSTAFSSNPDVRAFIFTDRFLDDSQDGLVAFINEYLAKYFKKPRLHKPPLFLFGNHHATLMQSVLLELYKYQKSANTGLVGTAFIKDSFVNNHNCPPGFVCKIAILENINANILEQCNVNQLYIVGSKTELPQDFTSADYTLEELNISDINALKYLVGLTRTMEA